MASDAPPASHPKTIAYRYRTGPHYSTTYVDGVVGVVVPGEQPLLRMSLCRDYPSTADQEVHEVELQEDGSLKLPFDPKTGVKQMAEDTLELTREMDSTFVFTPAFARELLQWLQMRLADVQRMNDEEE